MPSSRPTRPGAHHGGEAADGHGQGAPRRHRRERRRRPAALRRHACPSDRRDRAVVVTKIEKKGKQNRRIRVGVRLNAEREHERNVWQTPQPLARRDGMACRSTSTRRTSSFSTAPASAHRRPQRQGRVPGRPHIPGALFFDIDDIAGRENPLPHMLPSPTKFASRMKKMGVGDGMHVVVYDSEGLYSARACGGCSAPWAHERCARAQRRPEEMEGRGPRRSRTASRRRRTRAPLHGQRSMPNSCATPRHEGSDRRQGRADRRCARRRRGSRARVPEPRPGLRVRTYPDITQRALRHAAQSRRHAEAEPLSCASIFAKAGVDMARPVVATCGSGVTAGVVALALATLGRPDAAVYDGPGWSGARIRSLPIETRAAATVRQGSHERRASAPSPAAAAPSA